MASPMPLGAPDLRTSSVSKKREYEEFATSEARLDTAEGASFSADDYNERVGKRTRPNSSSKEGYGLPIRSNEASPDASGSEQFKSFPGFADTVGAEENGYVGGQVEARAHIAMSPAVTWNKGIPVKIRTSFGTSTSQKQTQSHQSAFLQGQQPTQQVELVRASTQAAGALSPGFQANASALSSSQLPAVPQVITRTLGKPKPENMRDSNLQWRWIFNPTDIGKAEEIVRNLPAAKRDLMPQQVPDSSMFFKIGKLKFALPLLSLSLREISLIDPDRPSFVLPFLNLNVSALQHVTHSIMVSAFTKYLGIVYAYLPKGLVSLVIKNTRKKSKGTRTRCAKALADAKNLRSSQRTEQTIREMDFHHVEQESPGNRETSSNSQAYGHADEIQNPVSSIDNSRNPTSVESEVVLTDRRMSNGFTATNVPPHPDHVTEAFNYSPDSRPGFYTSKEESPDTDTEAMMDVIRSPEIELTAMATNIPKSNDVQQTETGFGVMELELLRRYYPTADANPPIPRCLTCSDLDHRTSECPLLTCAICGLEGVHFTNACPQNKRCTKCWNRGHDKSRCPEKLAAAPIETPVCDLCQSKNHLEEKCHFLWRSFHPDSLSQKKLLVDISVFCYCCGSDSHFGPECGLRSTPLHTDGWTWSRTNWERYVDMKSNKRVFSAGQSHNAGASKKTRKDFTIKGKAKHEPVNRGDDDDDVQFIRERVKRPPPPAIKGKQQIKLNSKKRLPDMLLPDMPLPDMPFIPRPDLAPALPSSRQQPQRAAKSQYMPEGRSIDSFNSYRLSRDEPDRSHRERSFSPLPRFDARGQYGDMSYRPNYDRGVPNFRGYDDGRNGDDGLRGSNVRGDRGEGFGVRGSGNAGRGDANRGGGRRMGRRKRGRNDHPA